MAAPPYGNKRHGAAEDEALGLDGQSADEEIGGLPGGEGFTGDARGSPMVFSASSWASFVRTGDAI
ncbi:MAG TPA: hypothetical protein VHW02_09090 [Rhizomicrobium sp.]|jgi:hypothetical protein|nr:hypothetical protein [Rhizomicrobium sp.]